MITVLTIPQVAKKLQCSQRTVERLIEENRLECVQVRPRMRRVSAEMLRRFVEGER